MPARHGIWLENGLLANLNDSETYEVINLLLVMASPFKQILKYQVAFAGEAILAEKKQLPCCDCFTRVKISLI
ncbi:MAG: hypothetical protein KF746_20065 [Chitinophagaceae bacterium]|nr:hypothetical protein [Chitinophagaceae bacterium]